MKMQENFTRYFSEGIDLIVKSLGQDIDILSRSLNSCLITLAKKNQNLNFDNDILSSKTISSILNIEVPLGVSLISSTTISAFFSHGVVKKFEGEWTKIFNKTCFFLKGLEKEFEEINSQEKFEKSENKEVIKLYLSLVKVIFCESKKNLSGTRVNICEFLKTITDFICQSPPHVKFFVDAYDKNYSLLKVLEETVKKIEFFICLVDFLCFKTKNR